MLIAGLVALGESMSDRADDQADQEKASLALAELKLRLDYRKFIWGSVFAAIAIAAIPPSFQLATAVLEQVKSDADRLNKQQEFRDNYVKDFLKDAMNQNIELRIRFAEYFAYVSAEPYRDGWGRYKTELVNRRDAIRKEIDRMEAALDKIPQRDRGGAEAERLIRNIGWMSDEVGYQLRVRDVSAGSRDAKSGPTGGPITGQTLAQMFEQLAGRRDEAQLLVDAFAGYCTADPNDLAVFLAITLNESAFLRSGRTENFKYSPARLMAVWPSKVRSIEDATKLVAAGEEAVANFVYAGLNGNGDVSSGDGFRYRGRGYVMATGRDAYKKLDSALGLNGRLEKNPDLLADPAIAANASALLVCEAMSAVRSPDKSADLALVWRRISGNNAVPSNVKSIYDRIRGPGQ
jgi:predicted chitinase